MKTQLYNEDVQIGQPVPQLVKHPTRRQLVMWAAASEEYYEIHYDDEFARNKGLPGVVVHGMLMISFLGQMITDWIGDWGTLKKLKTSNRAVAVPNQDLTCYGKVSKKYIENGENFVQCEIWLETAKGEKSVVGEALVTLPSRNSGRA
jgi:acyl dehydratase